jgi:hypothetical protein
MTCFSLQGIPSSAISVIDGVFVVYVLIPSSAPRKRNDAGIALQFAKDLAEKSHAPIPIGYVVSSDSAPPYDLKAIFRQWNDKDWPFKGSVINAVDLDEAFDMLDRDKYSIKELQGDILPLGVDAEKLEVLDRCPR